MLRCFEEVNCPSVDIFCPSLKKKIKNFIYLFLAVLGLRCCVAFSLLAASGVNSPVVVHWLLIEGSSLVECTGFSSCGKWAQQLQLLGSRAQAQ